jgi:hypothetical protein
VERALNLWKSGNYISDQGDKKDKKRDFADANWGEKDYGQYDLRLGQFTRSYSK